MSTKFINQITVLQRKKDILRLFCFGEALIFAHDIDILTNEERADDLQNWISEHLKPQFDYATAISIMDCLDAIPLSQVSNGVEVLE